MRHAIVIPADGQPREHVPRGSALAAVGNGGSDHVIAYHHPGDSYGERCAQAIRHGGRGQLIRVEGELILVGWFDEHEGVFQVEPRRLALVEDWIGGRLYLNERQARERPAENRRAARAALMRGDLPRAHHLDPRRMGL